MMKSRNRCRLSGSHPLILLLLMTGIMLLLVAPASVPMAAGPRVSSRMPILLDTDIGTDIDDAFALALILHSPELDLLGVTTVSGDTAARARLAAKMLWEDGRRRVPVVAGGEGKPLPIEQTTWARDFTSPQILHETAVDFLDREFSRRPGQITLVAIGPLTNIAALLRKDPAVASKIKQIVMMGGSIAHGYGSHTQPDPEYNIVSDVAAAQTVFSSGVPIVMAPLDVTAMLQLSAKDRERIFNSGAPLTAALAALYHLWGHPTPILFDPMAVAMLIRPGICQTERLAVRIDSHGYSRVDQGGKPNAAVGMHTNPARFFHFYISRVAPQHAQ
ncbi:MAG: nucleoside hydrolase [Acidobacteriota bacterium]|nr:nucleoside hydrolase [Acidobacteriota bacterium]